MAFPGLRMSDDQLKLKEVVQYEEKPTLSTIDQKWLVSNVLYKRESPDITNCILSLCLVSTLDNLLVMVSQSDIL